MDPRWWSIALLFKRHRPQKHRRIKKIIKVNEAYIKEQNKT